MQYLCAEGCQLQHFIVADRVELFRTFDNPRVSSVNSVNIGINLAFLRVQGSCEGDRTGVRAAAPEGCHVIIAVKPLKAGNDDDCALGQLILNPFGVDPANPCVRVVGVGHKTCLPAKHRFDRISPFLNRQSQQCNRNLLTGREQNVHLAARAFGVNLVRLVDQHIGELSLRRYNGEDIIPLVVGTGNEVGDMLHPLGIGH